MVHLGLRGILEGTDGSAAAPRKWGEVVVADMSAPSGYVATHEVTNQSPPRVDVDEFSTHVPLVEGVRRYDAGWAIPALQATGVLVGSAGFARDAALAHRNAPVLHTHDGYGHRVDEVEYHPAYHRILADAVAVRAHTSAWAEPRPGANVARAAQFM
ncbi:MAG: hypothetical protein WA962_05010, partial [Ornithinimicrobium sp.]